MHRASKYRLEMVVKKPGYLLVLLFWLQRSSPLSNSCPENRYQPQAASNQRKCACSSPWMPSVRTHTILIFHCPSNISPHNLLTVHKLLPRTLFWRDAAPRLHLCNICTQSSMSCWGPNEIALSPFSRLAITSCWKCSTRRCTIHTGSAKVLFWPLVWWNM